MATVELGIKDFKPAMEKPGILLVDWWAPWCAPCRAFGPVYEKVSAGHPEVTFSKVNTENEQQLAGMFSIRSIPTLMIFRDGILLFSQPGMVPAAGLEDLIRQVKALDMDKVRAEIAKQERSPEARQS